jgi:hypothetical protein
MLRLILLPCVVFVLALSCRKEEARPVAETGASAAPLMEVAEPDLAPVLAELTQALRKYSAEKRAVPASLTELVVAGYIERVPPAPQGRAFSIDAKNVRVVLK